MIGLWTRVPGPLRSVASALVLVLPLSFASSCGRDETVGPEADPVAVANISILYYESTSPDPNSDATCQTGAGVLLSAEGSFDPSGQPLTFSWLDEVDYGDVLQPSADLQPNPFSTSQIESGVGLYTIGIHYITLKARTRDGRTSTRTLRVTVTPCEQCGP